MNEARLEAIALLGNARSRKRVSGAKRLRKLGDAAAGPALLEALQNEVRDRRTWEAQYHMILALGLCQFPGALPFLDELASREFDATILYTGLGDAIFRLDVLNTSPDEALDRIYARAEYRMTYGALRALAMLQLVPSDEGIRQIIAVASDPRAVGVVRGFPGDQVGLRQWAAVASRDWSSEMKAEFLEDCEAVGDPRLTMAVNDSRTGTRTKWSPY